MAKSSSCGCDGPLKASTSKPPGTGQKPPSGFYSAPRAKLTAPAPAGTLPVKVAMPTATTSAKTCESPAVPSPPVGGKAKGPWFWDALKRMICAPAGRLLVSTQNCFLNFFSPAQSGPVQFDHETGEVFSGPLTELAQLTSEAAIVDRGFIPLAKAEQRVVDGQVVWVLVHGTQVLNYATEGRLAVLDIDAEGQARWDLLIPPDAVAAASAPDGTTLLAYTLEEGANGCGKRFHWKAVTLPPQPSGNVTLTESNLADYKLQVWKDGKPYYASIPSNWFNPAE